MLDIVAGVIAEQGLKWAFKKACGACSSPGAAVNDEEIISKPSLLAAAPSPIELVRDLRASSGAGATVYEALGALNAAMDARTEALVAADAVPLLLLIIETDTGRRTDRERERALRALGNLLVRSAVARAQAVSHEGVPLLVRLLDERTSPRTFGDAAWALGCLKSALVNDAGVAAEAVARLARLVTRLGSEAEPRSGETDEALAGILKTLDGITTTMHVCTIDTDCVRVLVHLLRSRQHGKTAAGVLASLSADAREACLVAENGGVPLLLRAMEPEHVAANAVARTWAATALANVLELVRGTEAAVLASDPGLGILTRALAADPGLRDLAALALARIIVAFPSTSLAPPAATMLRRALVGVHAADDAERTLVDAALALLMRHPSLPSAPPMPCSLAPMPCIV